MALILNDTKNKKKKEEEIQKSFAADTAAREKNVSRAGVNDSALKKPSDNALVLPTARSYAQPIVSKKNVSVPAGQSEKEIQKSFSEYTKQVSQENAVKPYTMPVHTYDENRNRVDLEPVKTKAGYLAEINQAKYNAEQANRRLDEAKKNGANVTWNQALGRKINSAAQGVNNLIGGIADAAENAFNPAPSGSIRQDISNQLRNTELGRQNALIAARTAQRNAYEDALKATAANNLSANAMSAGNFASASRYNPNLGNDKDYDPVYETINRSRRYQTQILGLDSATVNGVNGFIGNREDLTPEQKSFLLNPYNDRYYSIDENLYHLTDEERAVYNWYYNTGDRQAAAQYLESIYPELEKRRYAANDDEIKKQATKNAVNAIGASIMSPVVGAVSGIAAIPGTIETLRTGRVNPYASYNSATQFARTARQAVADKIAESGTIGAKAASWIYQVGEDIFENGLRTAALGGLGVDLGAGMNLSVDQIKKVAKATSLSPMLLSVFQSTANEAKLNGRTDEEAITLASIAAGAEWFTESKSFEHLFDTYLHTLEGKGSAADWLGQVSTEALEEGGSNIINTIADILLLGDESEWSRSIRKYQQEEHLSESEAKRKAFIDKAVDFVSDVAGGAISGGVLGGGALLEASVEGAEKRQNRTSENTKSDVKQAAAKAQAAADAASERARAGMSMTADQWEQSLDQSDAAKKRRAEIRATGEKYNVSEEAIRTVEAATDSTGRVFHFYSQDPVKTKSGRTVRVNGRFDENSGEIWINSQSKKPVTFIIGHELTHSTELTKHYKALRSAAMEYLKSNGVDVDAHIADVRETYNQSGIKSAQNLSDDEIKAEMVADYVGSVLLTDEGEIDRLVNARHDAAQAIWNWINVRLTKLAGGGELYDRAMMTRAREIYGRALNAARPAENTVPTQAPAGEEANGLQPPTAETPTAAQTPSAAQAEAAAPAETPAEAPVPAAQARITPDRGVPTAAGGEEESYETELARIKADYRAGLMSDEAFTAALDALNEEYGRDMSTEYHGDMRDIGLENEKGEATYSISREDEEEVRDYVDKLPAKTKFSIDAPVEKVETDDGRNLIAVHGLNQAGLKATLELGAFPAASIAIVKDSMGHDMYGEYSVLFGRDTIDPKLNKKNNIYGGDAWTPTRHNAQVEHEIDQNKLWKIDNKLRNLVSKIADGAFSDTGRISGIISGDYDMMDARERADRLAQKTGIRAAYLASKGIDVEPIYKTNVEYSKYGNDVLQKFIDKIGADNFSELYQEINASVNTTPAIPYIETIKDIIREDYIEKNRERYSKAKNPASLENHAKMRADNAIQNGYNAVAFIVNCEQYRQNIGKTSNEIDRLATSNKIEEMTNYKDVADWIYDLIKDMYIGEGIRNNKGTFTPSGLRRTFRQTHMPVTAENIVKAMAAAGEANVDSGNSVLVTALPKYKSIDEVRANKDKLKMLSDDEYEEVRDRVLRKTNNIASEISNYNKESNFAFTHEVMNVIADAAYGKRTAEAIINAFAEDGIKIDDFIANEILDLYKQAAEIPTGYFEAKPMRVIGFDEVQAVLAPDDASPEFIIELKNNGFDVRQYKAGDTDDRRRVLNETAEEKDIKFSITPEEDDEYLKAVEDGDEETQRRIIDQAANSWAGGKAIRAYHGTPNGTFNTFRDWQYFTTNKQYADRYQNQGASSNGYKKTANSPKTYDVYLRIDKAFDTRKPKERRIFENEFYMQWGNGAPLSERRLPDWTDGDDLIEFFEDKGYDYDAIYLDEGGDGGYGEDIIDRGISIVIKNPNQIKSAELVTYDDDGNIIKPSERFNPENDDIRFSVTAEPLDNASGSEYNTLEADSRVLWGNEGQTRTSDLSPVSFRYAVVPADSLIISNDEYGNVNPDYPAELQPRDRARITSQADIQKMANGIIPDVLADSPYVNNGAPIIRGDGVVVGGNGRVAALRLAESTGKSGEYEDYIRENAARFGIEGELPENPILVRVADTDDWRELARKSNESTNAAMSSTEQALADADALDADILSMLAVDDEGELNTPKNRDFIAAFVNQVAGDSERGSLVDADGYLSQQGLRRVQAAVFAKAYKDTGMLARMSESLDDDMKNVTKALMGAASRAAVLNDAIKYGEAYDIDVTNEILAGIEIFEQAKKNGLSIDDIAGQQSLDGQTYGDAARAVAQYISANKRSAAKIMDLFADVYDGVISLGDPNQISMDLFGGGTDNGNVTVNEIFRNAARRIINEAETDLEGKPRVNLGFEIEDIGEQTSLPRNLRKGEAESVNGNGNTAAGNVQGAGERRRGTPTQRGGRTTLPDAGSAAYGERYVTAAGSGETESRQMSDELKRELLPDTGLTVPTAAEPEPKAPRTKGQAKAKRQSADEYAKATRRGADEYAERVKAGADEDASLEILRAQEQADLYRRGAEAEVSQRLDQERDQKLAAADNLTRARRDARAAAHVRKTNADITVPATDDTPGQKKMFDDQYRTRNDYKRIEARAGLSDNDADMVADLMAGRLSPEYDLGDADDPGNVLKVFNALVDYDRASRTVEAYRRQKNGELRETADRLLENSERFKDKKTGIAYERETQMRNIRDIAPAEDAEAINQEYFYPIAHHTRQANDLMREYNQRVEDLGISRKIVKGIPHEYVSVKEKDGEFVPGGKKKLRHNRVSEAYAVQFVGEMQSIMDQLAEATSRWEKYGANPKFEPKRNGISYAAAAQALDEFRAEYPSFDYEGELQRKIDGMKQIYSELLEKMNAEYMRWGYEPMGEIRGYFPHFISDGDNLLQKIGKRLGIDQSSFRLPTEIVGETADRKPGVRWFGNKLERKTNITDYDALEGFAKYIRGAADVIYHTEDIQKIRQFINQIRYNASDKGIREKARAIMNDPTMDDDEKNTRLDELYKNLRFGLSNYVVNLTEYANLLANKRSMHDRGWEGSFGRNKLYRSFNSYNRIRAMAAVAGNMTSALTNLIPVAQVTGIAGVGNTEKAFLATIANMFRRNGGDNLRLKSDFLMNRDSVDPVNMGTGEKAIQAIGWLFEKIDRLGSETVWRACYYDNRKKGMSESAAAAAADRQAAGVVADRSKGGMPTLFSSKNPLISIGTRFMLEANNTISYYLKDIPKERRDKGRSVLLGEAVALFFTWLYNEGFQALFGRRPAQEPSELVNDIVGDLTGYRMPNTIKLGTQLLSENRLPTAEDFKVKQGDVVKDSIENAIDLLPFTGWADLINQALGLNLEIQGGRFPVGDVMPDFNRLSKMIASNFGEEPWEKQGQVWAEELTKPLSGLLPGGNQAQKTAKGIATMIAGGSYVMNSKGQKQLQYPVQNTPGNWARAVIAGKSSLPTATEWVENGFDTLSAEDTEIYDMLTGYGIDPVKAVDLIKNIKKTVKTDEETKAHLQRQTLIDSDIDPAAKLLYYDAKFATDKEKTVIENMGPEDGTEVIKALDGLKASDKGIDDLRVLLKAKLSNSTKELMYNTLVSQNNKEKISALKAEGLDFGDYMDLKIQHDLIDAEDLKPAQKANEWSYWLDKQDYTEPQKAAIKDNLAFWGNYKAEPTAYEKVAGSGVDTEKAYDIYSKISELEPLPGEKAVSNKQKWDIIVNSDLTDSEQLDVIKAVSYDGEYYDYKISSDYGVNPKTYYDIYVNVFPKYDADGNGSYKQAEIKAALDSVKSLTNQQRAAIWQLHGSSSSAKNNPYSQSVGNYVLGMIKDMKAETVAAKAAADAEKVTTPADGIPTGSGSSSAAASPAPSGGGASGLFSSPLAVPRG